LILKSKRNNIDSRIYLVVSVWELGAWNLVVAHPETFGALVPIAGYVDRTQ
jgi:predicted peptidase